MGLFDKFKKKDKENTEGTFVPSDDSYITTTCIYNAHDPSNHISDQLMILFSFTEDYFHDAIEFLAMDSIVNKIYVHSSYDEDSGEKDTHNDPIYIVHNKYYLLVNGDDLDYYGLFHNATNIANEFIRMLYACVTQYRPKNMYENLIPYIPFEYSFNDKEKEYDNFATNYKHNYLFTDINTIMSRLPKAFNATQLLKCIFIYDNTVVTSAYNIIYDYIIDKDNINKKNVVYDDLKQIFDFITDGHVDDEHLTNLVGPVFLIQDEDAMAGSITNESMDEIFRQSYDRFMGIVTDDVVYTNIDESIGDNDETENMSEYDKINLFNAKEVFDTMGEELDQ